MRKERNIATHTSSENESDNGTRIKSVKAPERETPKVAFGRSLKRLCAESNSKSCFFERVAASSMRSAYTCSQSASSSSSKLTSSSPTMRPATRWSFSFRPATFKRAAKTSIKSSAFIANLFNYPNCATYILRITFERVSEILVIRLVAVE